MYVLLNYAKEHLKGISLSLKKVSTNEKRLYN